MKAQSKTTSKSNSKKVKKENQDLEKKNELLKVIRKELLSQVSTLQNEKDKIEKQIVSEIKSELKYIIKDKEVMYQ